MSLVHHHLTGVEATLAALVHRLRHLGQSLDDPALQAELEEIIQQLEARAQPIGIAVRCLDQPSQGNGFSDD